MSGRIQKEIIDNETYFIIEIDYNSTFDIQLDITDENGAAKNVSDLTKVYFTAKNSISNTDAAALININSSANSGQFNTSSASSGTIIISLTAANSILLPVNPIKGVFATRLDRTVASVAKSDIIAKGKISTEKSSNLNTS